MTEHDQSHEAPQQEVLKGDPINPDANPEPSLDPPGQEKPHGAVSLSQLIVSTAATALFGVSQPVVKPDGQPPTPEELRDAWASNALYIFDQFGFDEAVYQLLPDAAGAAANPLWTVGGCLGVVTLMALAMRPKKPKQPKPDRSIDVQPEPNPA